jgi:hypothetical protein
MAAVVPMTMLLTMHAAWGNDTSVALGADGLRIEPSNTITLEDEELSISAAEIRVRYIFRNLSDKPVDTLVAFPLPEIDVRELWEIGVDLPSDDPLNFVDFTVTVDGTPVTPQVEQRAFVGGVDVTDVVRRHGLPFTTFEPDAFEALMAVPKADRAALEDRQIVLYDEELETAYPQWVARTTFVWPQTFPPDKPVIVEHRYRPVVGHVAIGAVELEGQGEARTLYREPFCLDGALETSLRGRIDAESKPEEPAYLEGETVHYILTTASSWRGPIGRFHLVIETGRPDDILAVCPMGLEQTASGRYELERTGYVPERDLDILMLHHSLGFE